MKHFHYMLMLLALLVCQNTKAQFNPEPPDEPGARPWELTLKAVPAEAGYFNLNQQSRHVADEKIQLTAYTNSGYRFVCWEDSLGNTLTTERSWSYTMPKKNVTLTARYEYSPDAPEEPGQASIKKRLFLKTNPADAGRFNLGGTNNVAVGQSVHLQVYGNQNYIFRNWTEDGAIISSAAAFTYTMPDKDVTLTANFDFDYQPGTPDEPGQPQLQTCVIYAMREDAVVGKTCTFPIYFENNGNDVTGFSVDVSYPQSFSVNTNGVALTGSVATHSLSVSQLDENTWHFEVSGSSVIEKGNSKALLIPVSIPSTATTGSVYTVELKNGIMFKADGGQANVKVRGGSLKIVKKEEEKTDSPDYVITDLQTTSSNVTPGDGIQVTWKVENQGKRVGPARWTEHIYLVSSAGRKVSIGTTSYDSGQLQPGEAISRSAAFTLGQMPGIDGKLNIVVTIIPSTSAGETADNQQNNTTQTTGSPISLSKRLYLTIPDQPQMEGSVKTIRCQLARSGDWRNNETFTVKTIKGDSRISVPEAIFIPRDQSATYFYLPMANNDTYDTNSIVSFNVEGNGYPAVTGQIVIEDDEQPALSVTASKSVVSEGETFQLTITASQAPAEDLTVTLTSENTKRFTYPRKATIPAGKTSVTVDVTAKDDDIPSETLSNVFTASAARYNQGEYILILEDNDMPVLQLSLTPNKVTEGAGPVSVAGVLRRTGVTNNKITVRLSDDSNGNLYFGTRELVLNKGVEEVCFTFGPIDNAQVDGDRTYTVTAAVWLSSCSCSAAGESAGSVSAQLQVFDDDGPALALTSTMSTIKEGSTATLTVSRNTTSSLDQPLTVHLSSDYDENLSYDHTVTIPAGQQSAQVEITSKKNNISEDSHTVVFTVQADGFASGTCWIMVTDQTLPDAVITGFSVDKNEVEAGGTAIVNITIKNGGAALLPKHTLIEFFISGSSLSIGTLYTNTNITSGESETMTKVLRLPAVTGNKSLYCIVNNSREVSELLYTNNTSNYLDINLLSPYRATVACNKKIYLPGDTICFSGKVEGTASVNSNVEIYLINDGYRQTLSAVTDSEGKFSSSYYPYEKQMGYFVVGACYPGEGLSIEQDAFDYIGLRRTSQKYITCEVLVGTPYHGTIEVENPTALSQHNIRAEVLSVPENCSISFSPVSEIGAGTKYSLDYTIEGTAAFEDTEWKSIRVRIMSDEGASTEISLYYYCRLPEAQLALDVTEINTTVTKGVSRDYPIAISNNGAGETGRITLSLPSNILTATSQDMASIKPGETATAILRLTTTEDMALNVPFTGQIGINCENGNGIALPFTLLPVADTKGTLKVDVCDEYTYYTEDAPHVKGARVMVKYPYSDEVVTTGTTDDNGMFEVELPDGYYALTVTADKHESYQNFLLIDPGKENKKVVNLSYEGITVNWNVEETEIEDEYEITTTVNYETNVPVPVVVTELPKYIPVDSMAPGESRLFYATLTNKGLIAAEGVQLIFPEIEYLTLEPLVELPIKLLPQQTVVVPFRVTLDENVPLANGSSDVSSSRKISVDFGTIYGGKYRIVCEVKILTLWFWFCGDDYKKKWIDTGIPLGVDIKCHLEGKGDPDDEIEGGIPNGKGDFIWIGGGGSSHPTQNNKECKKCMEAFKDALFDGFDDFVAGIIPTCWAGTANCVAKKDLEGGGKVGVDVIDCAEDGLKCYALNEICLATIEAGPEAPIICSAAVSALQYAIRLLTWPTECMGIELRESDKWRIPTRSKEITEPLPSFIVAMEEKNNALIRQINGVVDFYKEIFGDDAWLEVEAKELIPLLDNIYQNSSPCEVSSLQIYKPTEISDIQFNTFIHRVNNSFFGGNYDDGGTMDDGKIRSSLQTIIDEDSKASQAGYASCTDMWLAEYDIFKKKLFEEVNAVCASVTLEIKQVMTLNRPAYRGTLIVFNGHDETAMKDVKLDLLVKDENGNIATAHEFQINAESLEGFGGEVSLDDTWTLDAQQTGKATVLFIPTKYAAQTGPKKYSFGGTLTFINPYTGLEKSMSLLPVQLTVNPLPDLELTYLMQRDVYGDDPLTENVVEPMEEAEFALIINNKGNGEAKNVRMLTEQPKIIENEKDLLINFDIVSSQVNGEAANLSFGQTIANDFGTIAARSQAYAQWWLRSTLLGHFTSYEVEAKHVTNYGNQDLSLVDTVTIHEMVHGFTPMANGKRGWLVNDIVDADDMPDVVYFADATQQPLYMATGSIERLGASEFRLTMTAKQQGWNYGSVTDPTGGRKKLSKIVRQSDGAELPVDNMWQTDRTLRDGRDWLYENKLHIVGEMQTNGEIFVLTFEEGPTVELAVESIIGVPLEGTLQETPLDVVTVRFTKAIQEETFTSDDITLLCQGERQDETAITINKQNDTDYLLNLSQVNQQDGYYVLTVQTAGITDSEGFNGRDGKSASWVQYLKTENPETYFYVTITEAGYATFYDSQWSYLLPNELSASVVSGASESKLTYTALDGNVVPKGVPVMLTSNPRQAGIYTLTSTKDGTYYNGMNLLRGSDEPTIVAPTSNEYAYKLAYGPSDTKWNDVVGWYWGAVDGGAFSIEGHKAWLVISHSSSGGTRGFSVDGYGIDLSEGLPVKNTDVFDLQGRKIRFDSSYRLRKGVYINNGQKIMVK